MKIWYFFYVGKTRDICKGLEKNGKFWNFTLIFFCLEKKMTNVGKSYFWKFCENNFDFFDNVNIFWKYMFNFEKWKHGNFTFFVGSLTNYMRRITDKLDSTFWIFHFWKFWRFRFLILKICSICIDFLNYFFFEIKNL